MHITHRVSNLDDFVGNVPLVKSLKSSYIDKYNNTPLMFVGNYGSGKTTLAKIIANHFSLNELENISEVNCGDKRKIEDARDIIKSLRNTSIFGFNKVIILDEIHRLNEHSQSAWLTELEKLPKNVLVIACTTTTENMLPTLKRRFIHYKVKVLSNSDCKLLIDNICNQENITLPKWLKALLIEKSNNVPGVILSNLPKVIDVTDAQEAEELLDVLNVDASKDVLDLFKMILSGVEWNVIKKDLSRLFKYEDAEAVRIGLMNIISTRMLSDYIKNTDEGRKLVRGMLALKESCVIPYKATLVSAIYEMVLIFSDEHYW